MFQYRKYLYKRIKTTTFIKQIRTGKLLLSGVEAMETTLQILFGSIIIGFLAAIVYARNIKSKDAGTPKMKEIAEAIHQGAMAFLHREYKIIVWFIIIFGAMIALFLDHPATVDFNEGIFLAISFVFGAICSLVAGYIGMKVSTIANVRTANAARKDIGSAFKIAFHSGSVMGLCLVSFAVLGITLLYVIYKAFHMPEAMLMEVLTGFALGGSSIALFCRVGGGIYTKAADVGGDLVGKVEKGIPEDDPRNPAVVADNVGDNVGDVAGMGADLFGSCAESTCAALVIGALMFTTMSALLYPVLISALGIVACLITFMTVRLGNSKNVEGALKRGLILSSVLVAVGLYYFTPQWLPTTFTLNGTTYTAMGVFYAVLTGLISGLVIGIVTEYFTSYHYKPVKNIAEQCKTGAATNIIGGLALGYESSVIPLVLIAVTVFLSYQFAGIYGIAVSALGMLSTLVMSLAIDAYGPVADNAGGIAEMSELPKSVRAKTDILDAAGNTTAAIGKGFAIGSAALTAIALFTAFTAASGLKTVDLLKPIVLAGILVGGMLPFIFSAMTMKAVGKSAYAVIEEVRRQFRTIKGLMQGKAKPDYAACVDLVTQASLKSMIGPGILVIGSPIVVGVLFGLEALAGLIIGALASGVVLAISMANSGGAWDNAKKYIETGKLGGKGSDAHKAAIVGDTVGDPFKDTSGPALNILIKLMSIVALLLVS